MGWAQWLNTHIFVILFIFCFKPIGKFIFLFEFCFKISNISTHIWLNFTNIIFLITHKFKYNIIILVGYPFEINENIIPWKFFKHTHTNTLQVLAPGARAEFCNIFSSGAVEFQRLLLLRKRMMELEMMIWSSCKIKWATWRWLFGRLNGSRGG